MARLRDTYGNSRKSGFTLDFFHQVAGTSPEAFLACPFYSTYEPIQLLTSRECRVSLLIRLCNITHPHALRKALDDPRVSVRYYTAQSFHAKFYIVGDKALVGSANLTSAGLADLIHPNSIIGGGGRDFRAQRTFAPSRRTMATR